MEYRKIVKGKFISRPNRFIAHVEIDGKDTVVHVKNTGRCKELLLPGADVILEDCENPSRKTRYDLIAVYKGNLLINMDSQAPNKVVYEWLQTENLSFIKPEYTYGDSRLDFYFERILPDGSVEKNLMEVKGCTLEIGGKGYFPDAPTERGVKHLRELASACKKGFVCHVGFVIQMEGIDVVYPNVQTHPEFEAAWKEAETAGVKFHFFKCCVTEKSLCITGE